MFVSGLLSGVAQIALFTAIPCAWWIITAWKEESFSSWLGLKKPVAASKGSLMLVIAAAIIVTFLPGEPAIWLCGDMETSGSAYKGMGVEAIPAILVYAFIQTALSEEILFRGFLLKRPAAKLGFWKGGVNQAAIFNAVHLLMGWGQVDVVAGALIMIYPMAAALLLGHLNENLSDGSILPSWIVHGALNTIATLVQAF